MIYKNEIAASIADELLKIGAVKLSPAAPFTWASGILSPIYCDNRMILSFPEAREKVALSFAKIIEEKYADVDIIAGVATGAIAHGVLVAAALNKPFIYIRDKPKGHGRQNIIEGFYEKGKKVVVIEDLISTGGSSLKAVQACEEAGLEVMGLLAIFSYQFKEAIDNFKQHSCTYYTLSDFPFLLEMSKNSDRYSKLDIDFMESWYASYQ